MVTADPASAMTIKLDDELPQRPEIEPDKRRAPKRGERLSQNDAELALRNALRYVPPAHHATMAPELAEELLTKGRIYGYRFRPPGRIWGRPIDAYSGRCLEGRAFQVMIDNNLDFDIALYPYELVTYGETGQVCQNWMQYRLIKKYLENLDRHQTLVVHSGHPLGLFQSSEESPRVINTNGIMVGMYDDNTNWSRAASIGVSNYGQMTAGGWMYIGPQGIVHGTYNTIVIAGRLKLGVAEDGDLEGKLFISSGLGGMSGAQGKAVMIANGAGIIAEVDPSRIETRRQQGWVSHVTASAREAFQLARDAQREGIGRAIAFHGNIVDLLEHAVEEDESIDMLTDQTSCHVVYDGGYCPQGLGFDERTTLLKTDRARFRTLVDRSLHRHYELIKALVDRGTFFFDYGNAFLKAIYDSGVREMSKNGVDDLDGFIWPSYVEDILGPELFDYGYGPFRWVCLSGREDDLRKTDAAAAEVISNLRRPLRYQDRDNLLWFQNAMDNGLVVGTYARILYQDAHGRVQIALKFNELVREGVVGPIMLGRDHHDPGGTDSPFRETANIKDGSNITADMAVHCYAGNAARGMSMVTLHNGGGVGIGKAINGGFGLVLDGSDRVDRIIGRAMSWDVLGGVARRAWARNPHAIETALEHNQSNDVGDHITLPFTAPDDIVSEALSRAFATTPK